MAILLFLVLLFFCLNPDLATATSEEYPSSAPDVGAPDLVVGAPDLVVGEPLDSSAQDSVSTHMFKLYDRYSSELNRPSDGNTVRSFKASPEPAEQKVSFRFNLTSLQDSEVILSSTLHILFDQHPRQKWWSCKHSKRPACRVPLPHPLPPVSLLFRGSTLNSTAATALGNVTFLPQRRGGWVRKDVSGTIKEARAAGQLLLMLTAELDFGQGHPGPLEPISALSLPYLLVFAEDLSIGEPNSVAATLQRYDPFPLGEDRTPSPNASPGGRVKRDAYLADPILDNELPKVEHSGWKNRELWNSAYLEPGPKTSTREGRRKGHGSGEGLGKPQVLHFDEKTMRKARRRQWSEPRVCSRRYLRVDFADIGWSEWILSPKSFDAYYCAGACGFPMSKVVHPSNHATIQSIVRTVGIVPGIPEPCCVPDKMTSLSVLFLDEGRNMVLKVYPSMSVETCSCQ